MQKTKTVTIDKETFTVKELSIKTIYGLINNKDTKKVTDKDFFEELLRLSCPELTFEKMLEMYPSEVDEIYQVWKEVNKSFLAAMDRLGIFQLVQQAVQPLIKLSLAEAVKKKAAPQKTSTGPSTVSSSPDTVQ